MRACVHVTSLIRYSEMAVRAVGRISPVKHADKLATQRSEDGVILAAISGTCGARARIGLP